MEGKSFRDAIPIPISIAFITLLVVYFLCNYQGFQQFKPSANPGPCVDYFQLSGIPRPRSLPNFDINKAKPRPYRPFRWEYHQTMAFTPLEVDWWIELESTYRERVKQRRQLYEAHGDTVVDALPGTEQACLELMFMVIQYLCARYPNAFRFQEASNRFSNEILNTVSDTSKVHPLIFLLNHVPEDFLITQRDDATGLYHLRAGVSCSAVGWNMKEKMGKALHEIHKPVPYYVQNLKTSVDRFFDKMSCMKPIQRGSWSLEIGKPLFLQSCDPDYALRGQHLPTLKIEDINLRVDWQTLRRMPQTKAIVFSFKALFTPVSEFRNEPYIPSLLAKVMRDSKGRLKEYKAFAHVEHKLLPALDSWSQEQEERGIIQKEWKERTLDEHPFFPGWMARYVQD